MIRAVWKYDLPVDDEQHVSMPHGSELLHVASQHGLSSQIQLWARVDPGAPLVERTIFIAGTGHTVDIDPYIGSVITADGHLIWHVFDGGEA
jgi:hypothetical protein